MQMTHLGGQVHVSQQLAHSRAFVDACGNQLQHVAYCLHCFSPILCCVFLRANVGKQTSCVVTAADDESEC